MGYNYDNNGRLNSVSGAGYAGVTSYASAISYRAFGAIKAMSFGDGKSLSASYDTRMRPTSWNVSNVLGYNYYYDGNYMEHTERVSYAQNIASGGSPTNGAPDPTLDRSYNYDQVGALQFARSGAEARATVGLGPWYIQDGPYSHQYDYDQFGNMTYRHGWGGEVQGGGAGQDSDKFYTYSTNKNQRDGFTYDPAGNLTSDGGQSYSYDAMGQQASASAMNYLLQQGYDGDGLRAQKTENGAVTYYLRSSVLGGAVVAEIDGSGNWSRGYVYAGGELMSVQQGGQLYWVHEDGVTKSKRITDVYGNVVSTVELDPWGANTNRSNNSAFLPQSFTTYVRDGNGDQDAMARRYDTSSSRFSQPDPYGGSYNFSDPQSLNRYAYTKNDPVNFRDPSGLDPTSPLTLIRRIAQPVVNAPAPFVVPTSYDHGADISGFFGSGSEQMALELGNDEPNSGGSDGGAGPPVDKAYGWWGPCNRSANDLMRKVRSDFSKFGNYGELAAEGNAVGFIKFNPGPITQGKVIGITVGAVSTTAPSEIYYSRNVSVTVSSATSMSFTFTTNPGHFFYPGTISFSASDTGSGVHFTITAKGELADREAKIGFGSVGGGFEDRAWKSFLERVRKSCGNQ